MSAQKPPELANFADFEALMDDFDLKVRREYVEPAVGPCAECFGSGRIEGGLCERCGGGATEAYGGYWQVSIVRERVLLDGRVYVRVLNMGDSTVERGFEEVWRQQAEIFNQLWLRDMEEIE